MIRGSGLGVRRGGHEQPALLLAGALSACLAGPVMAPSGEAAERQPAAAAGAGIPRASSSGIAAPESQTESSLIILEPGEIHTLAVDDLERIAVGDPAIVDVTVVSPTEALVQAKAVGKTNLIVWDRQGQRVSSLEVIDRSQEAAEAQLSQLIRELDMTDVKVKLDNGKLFLTGQVARQEELDRLEQMASAFQGVTNLVALPPPAELPAPPPPPVVKLAVQVLEINRTDLEKLGVKWSESSTFDPFVADVSGSNLLRWATSPFSAGKLSATLNALVQKNKARVLSEPKLVTASGKEASSFIGLDVPVVTATSFGTTTSVVSASIDFRQTGVLLKITPRVHGEGEELKITTVLEAEVSGIDKSVGISVPVGSQTVLVPGFKVRKANTEVTTASGETIMIAGLLEAEDSQAVAQVPALGGMPVLGRFFRSPETESKQRELVIAVTPEVLAGAELTPDKVLALERALAMAEVTASTDDPTLRYALAVQDRIANAIRYAGRDSPFGLNGQMKLRLHLLRDGTLGRAMIAEPSGIEAFDLEVLQAAQRQSPYPPFSSDMAQQELWLELPVLFRP
jgi:pilus assembly protein CpaC